MAVKSWHNVYYPSAYRLRLRPLASLIALASGLALLPWSWLGLLLIGIAALLLLLRWPWLVWLGIAVGLPITSGLKSGPVSLTEFMVAGAGLLWFVDGVRRRQLRLYGTSILVWLVLYIGVLWLALLQAVDFAEAAAEVIKWVEFAGVLLLMRSMLQPAQTPWLIAALVIGAAGQAGFGLYQFIYRIGPTWFMILGRFMRASGSFQQPNPYGGYLGLTLPVAVSLALWAWGELRRQVEGSPRTTFLAWWQTLLWALFYTTTAALIGGGLLASWSRGAWIGAVAALGVVVFVRSRQTALIGSGALGLGLLASLIGAFQPNWLPAAVTQRVQDLPAFLGLTDVLSQPLTDDNFAVVERVAHWVAALRMWELAPWLGIGPGNYATVYPLVHLPRWDEALGHAHNIYLNVLAESGLLGLITFLLFWGAVGLWVVGIAREPQQEGWHKALAIGVFGVLVHLSVHNFFDNLFVQGIYLHIALWLALVGVLAQAATPGTRHSVNK